MTSDPAVRLEAEDLGPPDPQYLKQGDVYSGVLLTYAGLRESQLRRLESGLFELHESAEIQSYGLVEQMRSDAIVLTYDCEIDRVLRWIRDGKAFASHHVCTVAAVHTTDKLEAGIGGHARNGNVTRYLCIAEHDGHTERFVDFSSIQNVPLERLLRSERLFGIDSQRGIVTLLQRCAYFVGSDERRKNVAPGDPNLLQAAIDAVARRS